MIGIYHSRDLDGFCSGAIIKTKYPGATMIGYDYGQPFNVCELIPKGSPVIMTDVSLPMKTMLQIAEQSDWQFTWIDHHYSAMKDYAVYRITSGAFLTPVLNNDISACEGAWQYLHPGCDLPKAIELLGIYDTWRNDDLNLWKETVLPFQFGMRGRCNSLLTFPIEVFSNEQLVDTIIDEGKTIIAYQRKQYEYLCNQAAFEAQFENHTAICLNVSGMNSEGMNSVYDAQKHQLIMPFYFNGKFWRVSLYTDRDDIDCSELAKKHGGGGHHKAAGFQAENIRSVFPEILHL